MIFVIYN